MLRKHPLVKRLNGQRTAQWRGFLHDAARTIAHSALVAGDILQVECEENAAEEFRLSLGASRIHPGANARADRTVRRLEIHPVISMPVKLNARCAVSLLQNF